MINYKDLIDSSQIDINVIKNDLKRILEGNKNTDSSFNKKIGSLKEFMSFISIFIDSTLILNEEIPSVHILYLLSINLNCKMENITPENKQYVCQWITKQRTSINLKKKKTYLKTKNTHEEKRIQNPRKVIKKIIDNSEKKEIQNLIVTADKNASTDI